MKNESYVCFTIYKHQIMKIKRLTLIALLFALCLIHPLFGDTIPTEGRWDDEYYRSVDTNRPPVASIEGDILSLSFEDALSDRKSVV